MYLSSWSGGKDSCFACYKALQQGYKITRLLNFISKEYQRVSFHGTEKNLIKIQSDLMGIPLYQKETTPGNYEIEFKDVVNDLKQNGINGMVFGDIYLDEHRDWVERVCREIGIKAIEPLWKNNTEELLIGFINAGFHAVVVSGQAKFIGKEWIGHSIDIEFVEYMKTRPDTDICGENGEYHTFVTAGPIFKGKIEVTEKEVISRNGYWFLNVKDYRIIR